MCLNLLRGSRCAMLSGNAPMSSLHLSLNSKTNITHHIQQLLWSPNRGMKRQDDTVSTKNKQHCIVACCVVVCPRWTTGRSATSIMISFVMTIQEKAPQPFLKIIHQTKIRLVLSFLPTYIRRDRFTGMQRVSGRLLPLIFKCGVNDSTAKERSYIHLACCILITFIIAAKKVLAPPSYPSLHTCPPSSLYFIAS